MEVSLDAELWVRVNPRRERNNNSVPTPNCEYVQIHDANEIIQYRRRIVSAYKSTTRTK